MRTSGELQDAVRRFAVCWEAFPELGGTSRDRKQVGFVIELYGTHNRTDIIPTAGCKHCIPVIQALLGIADYVVPDDWRDSLDGVRAHSGIEYARERGERPDIVVAITMVPRRGGRPDDNARVECLTSIKERLKQLGTHERSWPEGGAARE